MKKRKLEDLIWPQKKMDAMLRDLLSSSSKEEKEEEGGKE